MKSLVESVTKKEKTKIYLNHLVYTIKTFELKNSDHQLNYNKIFVLNHINLLYT